MLSRSYATMWSLNIALHTGQATGGSPGTSRNKDFIGHAGPTRAPVASPLPEPEPPVAINDANTRLETQERTQKPTAPNVVDEIKLLASLTLITQHTLIHAHSNQTAASRRGPKLEHQPVFIAYCQTVRPSPNNT
jgi:hypothetical protein